MNNWHLRALRSSLAFIWIATALGVLHPFYRSLGSRDLAALGLPAWVMYATCAGELLLGLRVALGGAATWLTLLQSALILGFTTILATLDPTLLVHPCGMLTKNLPLLAIIWTLWLVEREGWTLRATWLLRVGMAIIWITEGLGPKIFFARTSEIALVAQSGLVPGEPAEFLRLMGGIEAASGVLALVLRGWPLRVVLICQIVGLVVLPLLVAVQDPLLWVHPYGPLTKNVPILAGTVVVLARTFEVNGQERPTKLV